MLTASKGFGVLVSEEVGNIHCCTTLNSLKKLYYTQTINTNNLTKHVLYTVCVCQCICVHVCVFVCEGKTTGNMADKGDYLGPRWWLKTMFLLLEKNKETWWSSDHVLVISQVGVK